MLTLLEQLDKGTLWQSPGGIHPPELKQYSNQQPIARLPLAQQFIVPVPQVGEQARLLVTVGQHVLKGQVLTEGSGFLYLPVHAPTSGKIIAIEEVASNHPSGLPQLSCIVEADGQDLWCPLASDELSSLSTSQIIAKIKAAGIAGMGGAAFPSHIKLNTASEINLVIINGVECEPYITSDDRLMRDHSLEITNGIEIIHQILNPERIIIAIEDNKPEAAKAMEKAIKTNSKLASIARVTVIPTKYPSGGEKQLIQIITGKEVPSGSLPSQLGIVVHNVGTAYAIQDAVINGKPLIERVVTLTGNQIKQPGNYWLPIGTPISAALQQVCFEAKDQHKVIVGGPMMGYAITQLDVPILKGTNCILAPSADEIGPDAIEKSCIRCGECAVACPALLLPQQLFWHSKAQEYDKAASFNLKDCIECGCCSYVCPSDIPLVEYYRVAKSALRIEAEEKIQAEKAKQRFEARLKRLEDEKLAREAKAKEAAAKRQANMKTTDKDAVAAAMARIAAKKAAAQASSNTPSNVTEPVSSDNSSVIDKKSAVSAAIARAKAKKAAQAQQSYSSVETANDVSIQSKHITASDNTDVTEHLSNTASLQQDKIAAAVARAKAKKAALAAKQALSNESESIAQTATKDTNKESHPLAVNNTLANESVISQNDLKKQRVAAAIAKAKAKKALENQEQTSPQDSDILVSSVPKQADKQLDSKTNNTTEIDAKKAKIAAAVAKAKAKKAQQKNDTEQKETPNNPPETVSEFNTDTMPESVELEAPLAPKTAEQMEKKAKIAAAVAKAKAKKLAQQLSKED
ncbi:electron transport complex subunit RsxC [Shewanella aestuarii]|uniref:Ion-translocating oxidoreductase complex subunit C n=1 Tax=Shewanella aestuarii TaxID=1028752 RepID=A0A6G9QKR9_9GAMM|nr:electron transport complex subunit RsxC [Shewanella aestuarii]QIR14655.1 electron transport complex subunit RsxC [Shewanella aestuarii]